MLYIKANENKAKKLFEDLGANKRNKVVRNYWARYGEDGSGEVNLALKMLSFGKGGSN